MWIDTVYLIGCFNRQIEFTNLVSFSPHPICLQTLPFPGLVPPDHRRTYLGRFTSCINTTVGVMAHGQRIREEVELKLIASENDDDSY